MSTAPDHWLVRDYLSELDAAMRGLPAAAARELREQITAHLDDALGPDASDQEVGAALSRLGSPADLAAEAWAASGSSGPRSTLSGWRVRWRLAAIIAIPTVVAAVLGALQISSDASSYVASVRDQHLTRLDAAVVTLTQDLEDERDLSGGYAARRQAGPVLVAMASARTATNAASAAVAADAAGIGAGYQASTVQALNVLLNSIRNLGTIRKAVSSEPLPASSVIQVYTNNVIDSASILSDAVADGTSDARLQGAVTTLAALLRVENDQSVQRAILYAALSSQPPVLAPGEQTVLQQAVAQGAADMNAFTDSASVAEQQLFSSTVSGTTVDRAAEQEALAEQAAAARPSAPLTGNTGLTDNTGLDAATWYGNMSTTIGDTRKVTGQLVGQITVQANTLRSNATRTLLLTSILTVLLLLLVLLLSAALAHSLAGPLRKLRPGTRGV